MQALTVWKDRQNSSTYLVVGVDNQGRAKLIRLDPQPGCQKMRLMTSDRLSRMASVPFDPAECLKILTAARTLLAAGWCKYNYALDADGNRVPDSDPDAIHFSADGAICRATYDVRGHSPGIGCEMAFMMTRRFRPDPNELIHHWNDKQESAEPVIAVFDRTIEDLETIMRKATS